MNHFHETIIKNSCAQIYCQSIPFLFLPLISPETFGNTNDLRHLFPLQKAKQNQSFSETISRYFQLVPVRGSWFFF